MCDDVTTTLNFLALTSGHIVFPVKSLVRAIRHCPFDDRDRELMFPSTAYAGNLCNYLCDVAGFLVAEPRTNSARGH